MSAVSIAIVCESAADLEHACDLTDRVLCERHPWLDPVREHCRSFRGLAAHDRYLDWHKARKLADGAHIKAHGKFSGAPGAPGAQMCRRVLRLLSIQAEQPLEAVILLWDADEDEERRLGMERGRCAQSWPFRAIVIGVASPEREAWVLAGFEPKDEAEHARLGEVRRELGFDPRTRAHELRSGRSHAKRDAKRILRLLSDGDRERERACWSETPLSLLHERGRGEGDHVGSGLSAFLHELEERLAPLFGPPGTGP